MAGRSIAKKLFLKEGVTLLLVDAPRGYKKLLGSIPKGAVVRGGNAGPAHIIQLFVRSRKELERRVRPARAALAPGGTLWVTYPKGSSTLKSDINRDSIAAYARTLGMRPVAIISVDDDWSALRLKTA